jgi:hypothetical protein
MRSLPWPERWLSRFPRARFVETSRLAVDSFQIFGIQLTLSFVVYGLLAKWYVAPLLDRLQPHNALIALVFPHALRHLGLTILVPVVVDPNFPREWSVPMAIGDVIAQLLALACLVALRSRASVAIGLLWIFNVFGLLDLVFVMAQGIRLDVTRFHFGAFWFLSTFWLPVLVISHVLIFRRLLYRR